MKAMQELVDDVICSLVALAQENCMKVSGNEHVFDTIPPTVHRIVNMDHFHARVHCIEDRGVHHLNYTFAKVTVVDAVHKVIRVDEIVCQDFSAGCLASDSRRIWRRGDGHTVSDTELVETLRRETGLCFGNE